MLAPSSGARVLAAAVFLACLAGEPTLAHACATDDECGGFAMCELSASGPGVCRDVPQADQKIGAIVSVGLGTGLSALGIIWGLKKWDEWSKAPTAQSRHDAEVALYSVGGMQLALGALGIGLQASTSGPCGFRSTCQVAYGLGGMLLALGVTFTVAGITVSASPTPAYHPHRSRVRWVPTFDAHRSGGSVGVVISGFDL